MDNGASSYRRFLNGEKQAFEEIVVAYRDGLTFFINGYVHNLAVAEDITMDVFAEVLVHPHRYNFKTSLKTYLYMIGKCRSVDYLRREKRIMTMSPEEMEVYPAEQELLEALVVNDERKQKVHKAIEGLPDDMKTAVYLVYFEQFSYEEAAVIMKKNRKQIDNLLYRAKALLRTVLQKEGDWF